MVVQPAFPVEVLTLEAQRVFDFFDVQSRDPAIGAVVRGPHDFAVGRGEFLRGAKVIQLVVERRGVLWAEAFQQGQWVDTIGFVDVAAMPLRVVLGDQSVALPEKLGGRAGDGFADAATKRIVAVVDCLAVGAGEADQALLAVVAVFGNDRVGLATPFADEIAKGVVVVVAVILERQTATRRCVGEAFLWGLGMISADQTV